MEPNQVALLYPHSIQSLRVFGNLLRIQCPGIQRLVSSHRKRRSQRNDFHCTRKLRFFGKSQKGESCNGRLDFAHPFHRDLRDERDHETGSRPAQVLPRKRISSQPLHHHILRSGQLPLQPIPKALRENGKVAVSHFGGRSFHHLDASDAFDKQSAKIRKVRGDVQAGLKNVPQLLRRLRLPLRVLQFELLHSIPQSFGFQRVIAYRVHKSARHDARRARIRRHLLSRNVQHHDENLQSRQRHSNPIQSSR